MSPTEILRYRNMEVFGYGPNVMKKTKVCTRCGKVVKANAVVCSVCGERLSDETLFDRYKRRHQCCSECDTVLAPGSRYCPECGAQLKPLALPLMQGETI